MAILLWKFPPGSSPAGALEARPQPGRAAGCTKGGASLGCAPPGRVAEWFKAHAWKACIREPYRGFESRPFRQIAVRHRPQHSTKPLKTTVTTGLSVWTCPPLSTTIYSLLMGHLMGG